MAPLFEYRRSTRSEACWIAFGLVIPLTIFAGCVLWWLGQQINSQPIILAVVVVGTLVIGGMVWHVIQHLLIDGEFIVSIDEAAIQQSVPVSWVSDSFRVPIHDIDHVEREVNNALDGLVIVDRAGNRFKLNANYGNPLSQIANTLESLNVSVR